MNRDRNKLNIINMILSETRESKNTAYVASKDEAMFSAGSSDT